ncbi:hypothetical protein S40288_09615 [Stachybotrys chartarum IBT 40288]|nr:hypothetical protein S40288_09615 [Stachybotrys chartarum IBT 40288]
MILIFVHGLGSNPDTTWRAKRPPATADIAEETAADSEGFVDWVSEFLTDDLPAATREEVRMFYYDYDSYWKRDAVDTRLANLGDEVLEHIREIRESDAERSRGLVFVGYSYGGLVVKQALPLGSNPIILANLEYVTASLLDLHRAFTGTTRDNWHVYKFFEQRPTRILRLWLIRWQQLCVREPSATYEGPNIRNIGVPVDHAGLNKFGSRSDSYRAILSKLIEATAFLADSRKHHYAVPLGRVHTYMERAELSMKMEEMLQTRHEKADAPYAVALHGLGGAGKSQLALDYAEQHRDQYGSILWIDATDEEAARFSFRRCAAELGLSEERAGNQGSVVTDTVAQAVLRWLRDRAEVDGRWLVIIGNADDVS